MDHNYGDSLGQDCMTLKLLGANQLSVLGNCYIERTLPYNLLSPIAESYVQCYALVFLNSQINVCLAITYA